MRQWTNVVAVLDDEPDVLNAIDRLLSAHGYERELYDSAHALLTAAATSKASCAIVDVHLGSNNGIALVQQLRQGDFAIPVIFITGSEDEAVHKQAVEAGCVAFVRKPFIVDLLIAALADARQNFE